MNCQPILVVTYFRISGSAIIPIRNLLQGYTKFRIINVFTMKIDVF